MRPRRTSIEACLDGPFHQELGIISTNTEVKDKKMCEKKISFKRATYEQKQTKNSKYSTRKTRVRKESAETFPALKAKSNSCILFSAEVKKISAEDLIRFHALFEAAEFFTEHDNELLRDVEDILPSLHLLRGRRFHKDDFMKRRKKPSMLSLMR